MTPTCEEILRALISFPTVSLSDNRALLDYVVRLLHRQGIACVWRQDYRAGGQNLIVRLGPEGPGGLLLSGHTDVVPIPQNHPHDSADWYWRLGRTEGRYTGRGVCDMKGFLACALALLPEYRAGLRRPLWLVLSADEEIGCRGMPAVLQLMREVNAQPAAVIVGEPSELRPVVTHKGIATLTTTIYGQAAHSSLIDQGCSAIFEAARVVVAMEQAASAWRARHPDFPSTLHVGTLHGGTAPNVKAQECRLEWEIRHHPEDALPELIAEMEAATRQALRCATFALQPQHAPIPPLAPEPSLLAELQALLPEPEPQRVGYATEAGFYQGAGFPTLVLGPGNIAQAHSVDEWIDCAQIEDMSALLHRLIAHFCQ